MAGAALLTGEPFIFPSLGPTAFLLFYTPTLPAASPRNTLCGHAIGAAAGYLALVLFGLTDRGAGTRDRRHLDTRSAPPHSRSGSRAGSWCGPRSRTHPPARPR